MHIFIQPFELRYILSTRASLISRQAGDSPVPVVVWSLIVPSEAWREVNDHAPARRHTLLMIFFSSSRCFGTATFGSSFPSYSRTT